MKRAARTWSLIVRLSSEMIQGLQKKLGAVPDGIVGHRTVSVVLGGIGPPPNSMDPSLVEVPQTPGRKDGVVEHNWYEVPLEEQKADPKRFPNPRDGSDMFWAVCRGCGATIIACNATPSSRWHEGWKMQEDCDMQKVQDVMES